MKELKHPGLFKDYRICPACDGRFTPDRKTKQRQLLCLIIAIVSLVFTVLLYYQGAKWLFPSLVSYLLFGGLVYWGNRKIYLVPYEAD